MAKSAKAGQVLKFRRALRVFRFRAVDGASGETEMPEKGPEELFVLASGPEGVGKKGRRSIVLGRRSFFDFRRDMAIGDASQRFKCG